MALDAQDGAGLGWGGDLHRRWVWSYRCSGSPRRSTRRCAITDETRWTKARSIWNSLIGREEAMKAKRALDVIPAGPT